ncbi:MAG: metallophosphoesterase [Magnetovibrio sp.]|nr:metallophosphoesterase [Magnetovibrio sp.]
MSKLLASMSSIDELLERIPDTQQRLYDLNQYLVTSEQMLTNLMAEFVEGISPITVSHDAEGSLEFGAFLHWLNHSNQDLITSTNQDPAAAITYQALMHFAPTSIISPAHLSQFISLQHVSKDGTLWAFEKYAQLDGGWLTAGVNYAINLLDPESIYHPYPTPDQAYKHDIGTGNESLSLAIIGDWGTGAYGNDFGGQGPAIAVMNAVRALKPDYAVHLGDVYYSGSDERLPQHEEQNFLVDQWNTGLTAGGTNFTINSNHEMYGAAQGLIGVALAPTTPFAHQNKTPYFALNFGQWVIIGLDSAYFDPSTLYMDGALGNSTNTQQQEFVQSLGDLSQKKVLVMTHHNPMSFDGKTISSNKKAGIGLWDGMTELLGKQPDAWYWGHLHLGVAYNENSILGATGTTCRCVGHGAIPYGNAYGMDTNNVDYYAHTPLKDGSKQVQNSFAMLTLNVDGTLSETFYEVTEVGGYTKAWESPKELVSA